MKIRYLAALLAVVSAPGFAAVGTTEIPTFAGQAAAAAAAKTAVPQTPEQWLGRMTDFTQNMSAFRDPKMFVPWTNAITEPSFYVAMAKSMMDPGGWLNMMNSMAHPDVVRNYIQFLDPNTTIRWVNASADPAFYTALLTQLSDPGKLMRWGMLPLDPKLFDLSLSLFNPNTYIRWPMAMLDPRAWNLMGNVANPALYTGMVGALVNAQPDGSAVNSWLSWKPAPTVQGAGSFAMWDPVAMLGNLSGYIPGMSSVTLPSLPDLSSILPKLPTLPAPAAMPSATVTPAAVNAAPAMPAAAPAMPAIPQADSAPAMPAAEEAPVPATKPATTDKAVLGGDALFKSGKSRIKDLTKDGKATLDALADKIKAMGEVQQVRIVGHADKMGKARANMTLSEARARSVKSYLVAKGIKPGVIITSGAGDTQPVVDCDMSQSKAKLIECLAPNRRVEVEIISKP